MVDLGKMENATVKGTIIDVKEMTLREYLEIRHGAKAEKVIAKFNPENVDRPHVVLMVESNGTNIDWFGMIPSVQGYNKSNLKRVKDRNDLPNDTAKWLKKDVDLRVDNNGFLRVAT